VELHLHSHNTSSWRGAQLKYRVTEDILNYDCSDLEILEQVHKLKHMAGSLSLQEVNLVSIPPLQDVK
jgi:hypothetical protein